MLFIVWSQRKGGLCGGVVLAILWVVWFNTSEKFLKEKGRVWNSTLKLWVILCICAIMFWRGAGRDNFEWLEEFNISPVIMILSTNLKVVGIMFVPSFSECWFLRSCVESSPVFVLCKFETIERWDYWSSFVVSFTSNEIFRFLRKLKLLIFFFL